MFKRAETEDVQADDGPEPRNERKVHRLRAWRLAGAVVLALAMVLEGLSRTDAAQLNGMDRQTLRDWASLQHRRCGRAEFALGCGTPPCAE